MSVIESRIIKNFVQVNTLLLSWQSNHSLRRRYVVGQLQRQQTHTGDVFRLSYLTESTDYQQALQDGFEGFPAFPVKKSIHYENGVLVTFMKRLPPRSRQDFKKYLAFHHLPSTFNGDDFALITHTGMSLPSDGFNVFPNLAEAALPFDYVMEVAGTRHLVKNAEEISKIQLGMIVELIPEEGNQFDDNAVQIKVDGQIIGYVPRPLSKIVRYLLNRQISCSVIHMSETKERFLINVMLSVK